MAQWPLIVEHLLSLFPTLPGWSSTAVTVSDGVAYDVATAAFVTVGHSDSSTPTGGTYRVELADDGCRYLETGSVVCHLTVTADSPEIVALRSQAFGYLNSLEEAIRSDKRLGVLSAEGFFSLEVEIASAQLPQGAGFLLPFSLNYYTVT